MQMKTAFKIIIALAVIAGLASCKTNCGPEQHKVSFDVLQAQSKYL
jgi:uncharacterized lipoprotein